MSLLPSILGATQTPHQPLLVIQDSPAASGVPLLAELVQRARNDGSPIIFICALHAPAHYGLFNAPSEKIQVLNLTDVVPGYTVPSSSTTFQPESIQDISRWIVDAVNKLGRRTQVFIDALDIIAGDYGTPAGAVKLVKDVLKVVTSQKAPSRLNLLLPSTCPLLPHLTPSSLSSTLTLLALHPPALVRRISTDYLLAPPPPGLPSAEWDGGHARWWGLLKTGAGRGGSLDGGWAMALTGDGAEVGEEEALAVEVLVRKAQGGASKGMSRSLEGLARRGGRLDPVRWDELPGLVSLSTSMTSGPPPEPEEHHPSQSHIPFNLSLTPAQAASRADVPVPYAHEGDEGPSDSAQATSSGGAGQILFEPGSGDDMDEDDPDEDLDF